jgi:2-keto-4-pentenoate hydratase/2-oxohepta-3-ene-1,7-dioic acid hydratase in catechol pathway
MKTLNALNGPNDDVIIPRGAEKTDWEIELAMIIGKQAHHVDEAEALDYVAGYAIANDVSERAFQTERAGQWTKGKSCDTFGPLGPWLVTRDEIADPQNLDMTLDVNGKRFQDGNTKTMIFNCAHLVAYLSTFMTLFPGDVISTGTPPGVGMGIKPAPVFLKAGDEMTLNIAGLGTQHSRCIAWSR